MVFRSCKESGRCERRGRADGGHQRISSDKESGNDVFQAN